jgi:hypothetical protein
LLQFEKEHAERETFRNTELTGIREELAGIRGALLQMSGLLREMLDNKN